MHTTLYIIVIICLFIATPILGNDIATIIDSGYVNQVKEFLKNTPELINSKDHEALTPLNRAAYKGKQILTNSLDCGALATNMFVKDFLKNKSNKSFFLFLNYQPAQARECWYLTRPYSYPKIERAYHKIFW